MLVGLSFVCTAGLLLWVACVSLGFGCGDDNCGHFVLSRVFGQGIWSMLFRVGCTLVVRLTFPTEMGVR